MCKTIVLPYLFPIILLASPVFAQGTTGAADSPSRWLSLGGRSTVSVFSDDGRGLGTGGMFRIQLNDRVNSDWFADYIVINMSDAVRSEYYHIGWSILYYPLDQRQYPVRMQPYILAGHCFDYNRKTSMQQPWITKDRWGSAVQAGLGTHVNLTEKMDISFTAQYMIHLTNDLEVLYNNPIEIQESQQSSLEGHLLVTVSINHKILKLWKKK